MVHIEKGKKIVATPSLVIYSETGDYDEEALIECALEETPDQSYCAFQAQHIATIE